MADGNSLPGYSSSDLCRDATQHQVHRRDHEQVHGCDLRRMVAQKRAPALPARIAFPGHILGDGRLSYLEAELEQLTMDPRRTPKNVLNAHAPDQRSQTHIDLRPASHAACFPAPIAAETGSMPAHNSFRSDQRNSPEPRGKPTMQLDEEQAVAVPEVDATTHLASQSHTGTS